MRVEESSLEMTVLLSRMAFYTEFSKIWWERAIIKAICITNFEFASEELEVRD